MGETMYLGVGNSPYLHCRGDLKLPKKPLVGGYETVWIPLFKDVQAVAESHSKASSANEMNRAGLAFTGADTILSGCFRIVDFSNALFVNVAYGRGKFPASVNFSIGKYRHEVECRATAIAGASAKGLQAFFTA